MSIAVPNNEDFLETLAPLIKELLIKKKFSEVLGVQALSSFTEYTVLQAIENIINTLFILTLKKHYEADTLKEDLKKNLQQYKRKGMVQEIEERIKKAEEGKISIMAIRSACGSLRKILEKIVILKDAGFIEVLHKKGTSPFNAFVKLSSIWDDAIEQIKQTGYEAAIFGSAMGKMIALGLEKKGISSLIPLIFGIMRAANNKGEILMEDLREEFTNQGFPYYRFSSAIERDNVKDKDIRMITSKNGKIIEFSLYVQNFIKLWHDRALKRTLSRIQP